MLMNQIGEEKTNCLLEEALSLPKRKKIHLGLQKRDVVKEKQRLKRKSDTSKMRRIELKKRKTALLARKAIWQEGNFQYGALDDDTSTGDKTSSEGEGVNMNNTPEVGQGE